MPAHWETRPCHSEGSLFLPQRGLCKSREPDGLAPLMALEIPLMVREQMNSTPKVQVLPLDRTAVRSEPSQGNPSWKSVGTSDSPR